MLLAKSQISHRPTKLLSSMMVQLSEAIQSYKVGLHLYVCHCMLLLFRISWAA